MGGGILDRSILGAEPHYSKIVGALWHDREWDEALHFLAYYVQVRINKAGRNTGESGVRLDLSIKSNHGWLPPG